MPVKRESYNRADRLWKIASYRDVIVDGEPVLMRLTMLDVQNGSEARTYPSCERRLRMTGAVHALFALFFHRRPTRFAPGRHAPGKLRDVLDTDIP